MPWVVTGSLFISGFAVVWLAMRLRAYRVEEGCSLAENSGSEAFSIAQYEPMNRLLAEEDLCFLASQPGYRPEIGKKFRKERRRVFRLYLHELASDFRKLHAQARAMVAESQEHQAELVTLLIRQQLTFWRAMAVIELRLVVHGVGLGRVDVRGLVEAFEAMHRDLLRFTGPAPASV